MNAIKAQGLKLKARDWSKKIEMKVPRGGATVFRIRIISPVVWWHFIIE